jgi:hypothetical protein
MDKDQRSGYGVVPFVAALAVGVCATSAWAQSCEGSLARAVQVTFADCGEVHDSVSVCIGSNSGALLPLSKAPSGYWEADNKTFDPKELTLCSFACNSAGGCARPSETVWIDRGRLRVCAARYVIRCTDPVWRLHVDFEPGPWIVVYKRLKRASAATEAGTRSPAMKSAPFDVCNLASDEEIEPVVQLQGIPISIPLQPILMGSFGRASTVNVNRDELARRYQAALGTKRTLSPQDLDVLPKVVTFKMY